MAVNRGVTDISNAIDNVQFLHDFGTDFARVDLSSVVGLEVLNDVLDGLIQRR